MSQYGGQRRADDRRGTYTQKLASPVDDRRTTYTQKKKSINGEDDDDRRSIATTRGRQKPSLAVISTHRLQWINLVRYLELELKDFGVQLPKDAQVRQPSRCVFLWPMTACRVLVLASGDEVGGGFAQLLTSRHGGFRRWLQCSSTIIRLYSLSSSQK